MTKYADLMADIKAQLAEEERLDSRHMWVLYNENSGVERAQRAFGCNTTQRNTGETHVLTNLGRKPLPMWPNQGEFEICETCNQQLACLNHIPSTISLPENFHVRPLDEYPGDRRAVLLLPEG